MSQNRLFRVVGWAVVVVLFLLLPKIVPEMKIHMTIEILIFSLFAVSFNLLIGYTGLMPFGYAAMFGVGAYACALMVNHVPNTHLFLTLLVAALSGFVAAVVIGFFSVRLGGTYFALITLAFQMFLFAVATKWRAVTNGDDGMGVIRPDFFLPGLGKISIDGLHTANLYYLILAVCGLGVLVMYLFLKTPLGNAVVCMKENDVRASFLGYNVFRTRLAVFSGSGLIAGLAGGL